MYPYNLLHDCKLEKIHLAVIYSKVLRNTRGIEIIFSSNIIASLQKLFSALLFEQKRITIQSEGHPWYSVSELTHIGAGRAELRYEIVPSIRRSRNPNVIEFSRTSNQKTNDVSFHHSDFEAF